jgi:2-methylisocitrate lyase-like PEP mutase family enzyme
VERVRAAVAASRSLPYPFTLTARAENYLHKRSDLADTIRRLQAFQDAGADVLYAPGLVNRSDIAAVVKSVDRPVNVLISIPGANLTLADLSKLGVKRLSTGGALSRAAFGAVFRAAVELRDEGTFHFVDAAISSRDMNAIFEGK